MCRISGSMAYSIKPRVQGLRCRVRVGYFLWPKTTQALAGARPVGCSQLFDFTNDQHGILKAHMCIAADAAVYAGFCGQGHSLSLGSLAKLRANTAGKAP